MSRCLARERTRAHNAADTLAMHDRVEAVDVLAPDTNPTNRWTIELVLCARGVPHDVLDVLGSYQLTLRDASPQGTYWQAVAVA
jgi:hypothetical protein